MDSPKNTWWFLLFFHLVCVTTLFPRVGRPCAHTSHTMAAQAGPSWLDGDISVQFFSTVKTCEPRKMAFLRMCLMRFLWYLTKFGDIFGVLAAIFSFWMGDQKNNKIQGIGDISWWSWWWKALHCPLKLLNYVPVSRVLWLILSISVAHNSHSLNVLV